MSVCKFVFMTLFRLRQNDFKINTNKNSKLTISIFYLNPKTNSSYTKFKQDFAAYAPHFERDDSMPFGTAPVSPR